MTSSPEVTRWLQDIGTRQAEIAAILTDPTREASEAYSVLTRSLALSLNAERVGIWTLDLTETHLVSCDVYDRLTDRHANDVRLENNQVSQYLAKLRCQGGTFLELTEGPFPPPIFALGQKWPDAQIAIVASSGIALSKTGFLTAARVTHKAPWLPEEIALVRSAVNYLPILFHAQENCRSLARLRNSLSLLTGTLESTVEGIVVTDLNRRIVLANQRFMEIIGRPNEKSITIKDLQIKDLLLHLTKYPERVKIEADRIYTNLNAEGTDQIEYLDGTILERYSRPQRVEGQIVGRIFSYRDVTAQIHAQKARTQLENELRQAQKLEAIGVLAGGIAHDFNNILSGISCNVELLRGDLPADHPAQESVREIATASRRAADLVRQILTFSRQTEPVQTPVDATLIISEALRLLRATIPATIDLKIRLAKNVPAILADPTALHQVVINLCTNARQAIGDATGTISVSVGKICLGRTARPRLDLPPGVYLKLSVRDTGCGMDKATLNHLFEPFFTTKSPGAGTGLGLSVVHGIVRAHHGTIKVASQPGRGAHFALFFPEHQGPAAAANPATEPSFIGNSETVLLVDDEPILTHVGGKILERLGYRPIVFQNAREALAAFNCAPASFAAAIVDLVMPSMNGLDLARELHRSRPDLPVVLATGNQAAIAAEKIQAAGVTQILPKPLTGQALAGALVQALGSVKE